MNPPIPTESKISLLAKLDEIRKAVAEDQLTNVVLCYEREDEPECSVFLLGELASLSEIVIHLSDTMKEQIRAMQRESVHEMTTFLQKAGILGEERLEGLPEGIEAFQFTRH